MTPSDYIRENFEPQDRLAIVLLDKRSGGVIQRIASASQIASATFQNWLRHRNNEGWDVYASMNALLPEASGRTKTDIGTIRHLYLDFDEGGTEAVQRLLQRSDLPCPNFQLNTSPGKWQVIWKVDGFTAPGAEGLQRSLARETRADWAATDCARVLRLPGFFNRKYRAPHLITAEQLSDGLYGPPDFPRIVADPSSMPTRLGSRGPGEGVLSQSERDWAFARRALARGEPEYLVIAQIANHRRYDKHDPNSYAERTVRKAVISLSETRTVAPETSGPER